MFYDIPTISPEQKNRPMRSDYYSVEFPSYAAQPVYQFKLWPSEHNSFFLLAKDESDLVSQLKVGCILPMKYYSEDAMRPIDIHDTQIMEIVKETDGRFRGHYRIELDIAPEYQEKTPQPENNDSIK